MKPIPWKRKMLPFMKMKIGTSAICSCALVLAAFNAQAQITYSSGDSLSTWNGTPDYTSMNNANLADAQNAQGSPTITGSYGVIAETFTPTTSFTLGSFAILLDVTAITSPTYTINLYDLGAANTVSVSASSASYNPYTPSPAGITLDFSDTVTFAATSGGQVQGTFTLAAADQTLLAANEEYALEILIPSADGHNGVEWFRGASEDIDPGGQMMVSADAAGERDTLVTDGQTGGQRTGALALYAVTPVPEPSSLALIGAGIMALGTIRRFKK